MYNINNRELEMNEANIQSFRRKRNDYIIEIRRQKRNELIVKKRSKNYDIDEKLHDKNPPEQSHNLAEDQELKSLIDQWLRRDYEISEFQSLSEAISSPDRNIQHYGIIGLRKILSNDKNRPIQTVIDANVIPRLIELVANHKEPHLQMEATWALANIASGTTSQIQSIVDKGGIYYFVQLLKCDRMEIVEQAIWAIANIACDSAEYRDLVLKCRGLQNLLYVLNKTTNRATIKNGVWAVSNLCSGTPAPSIEETRIAIPTLSAMFQVENDTVTLTEAAWALFYLSRTKTTVSEMIQTGIIPSLVKHLRYLSLLSEDDRLYLISSNELKLVNSCLKTLGNFISGDEKQTDMVIKTPEFLAKLYQLLFRQEEAIRTEVSWSISNITAGTALQIECIMGDPLYVQKIIEMAVSDTVEVQREVTWILSNATKGSTPQQFTRIIQQGVLECFVQLLDSVDAKTVEVALQGISNILDMGVLIARQNESVENLFLVELENREAIKKIEKLQYHSNYEVYQKSLEILENHFDLESVI